VFELILFPGLGSDIFKKLNIAKHDFLIPAKIKQVDNDGYQNREKQIQKIGMFKSH